MTAKATGVKKIEVTFNKVVDPTKATVTVKKASATPAVGDLVWASDNKSVTIPMTNKMTEGTYTVSVAGLEDAPLTADVPVENEKLTSFVLVNDKLVASQVYTTCASISYKALNQYEEMMRLADEPTISCTFGKYATSITLGSGTVKSTTPSADNAGTAWFEAIPEVLCIPNQAGTITIVDNKTGVNLSTAITYQPKAKANKATVAGIYNEKTEKLLDGNMTVGDRIGNYFVLINVKDQYESDMTASAVSDSGVSLNSASILTDVKTQDSVMSGNYSEMTYEGANYIKIPLVVEKSGNYITKEGTLQLTIVSNQSGVLATPSFTISPRTTISTFTVSQDGIIKAKAENKLIFEALDENGNPVTDYNVLSNTDVVSIIKSLDTDEVYFAKKTDGTADLIYKPSAVTSSSRTDLKNTDSRTLTFGVNATASGKYFVKTLVVTVSEKAQAVKVAGVSDKTSVAVAAVSGKALTFDLTTLNYADQYDDAKAYKSSGATTTAVSAYLVDKTGIFSQVSTPSAVTLKGANPSGITEVAIATGTATKIIATASGVKGTAKLYLKYYDEKVNKEPQASTSDYDIVVTLSAKDLGNADYSDIKVESVNGGYSIYATGGANSVVFAPSEDKSAVVTTTATASDKIPVVVSATLNGQKVIVPTDSVTINTNKLSGLGDADSTNPARTETKDIEVVVSVGGQSYKVTGAAILSNKGRSIMKVESKDAYKFTTAAGVMMDEYGTDKVSGCAVTMGALNLASEGAIKATDQYGAEVDIDADNDSSLLYEIAFTGDNAKAVTVEVTGARAEATKFVLTGGPGKTYKATITITKKDDTSFTPVKKDIEIAW